MKTKLRSFLIVLALLALSTLSSEFGTARAQGTAFNYQGQINVNGTPANGLYDMYFALYTNSSASGNYTDEFVPGLSVMNGSFSIILDFGQDFFTGPSVWMQISVRSYNTGTYTKLTPLQPILPTPYAIYAATAGVANSIAATNISGILGVGQLPAGVVLNNQTGFTFSGNGGGLTNLNASQLTSVGNNNGGVSNFFIGLAAIRGRPATSIQPLAMTLFRPSLSARPTGPMDLLRFPPIRAAATTRPAVDMRYITTR